MRTVFNRLNGKHGNQLKLLIVLMGTSGKHNFRVSQKWITDLTGMDESGYKRARKALADMGWITHENGYIAVNFDAIWAAAHDASPSSVTPERDMTSQASYFYNCMVDNYIEDYAAELDASPAGN